MPSQFSFYTSRNCRYQIMTQSVAIAVFLCLLLSCQGNLFAQTDHPLEGDYQKALLTERQGRFIEALGLLKEVAEKGHPGAQNYYGYMLDKSDEDKEAVKWYKKSAQQDNIEGMLSLAKMYAAGEGIKQDIPQAVKWYEKAAKLDSVGAINALAYAYRDGGLSFEKNNELAFHWFNKAAELGDINIMLLLAVAYEKGQLGLNVNNTDAIRWYQKAAEKGDYTATKKMLAVYKDSGLGVKADPVQAEIWRLKLNEISTRPK